MVRLYLGRCRIVLLGLILALSSGCVYEGPRATPEEVAVYQRDLASKAVRYRLSLWKRVAKVGYRIITHIPKELYQGDYPYLGLVVVENNEETAIAFDLPEGRFLVIGAKVPGTSCEDLAVSSGEILLGLGDYAVRDYRDYLSALYRHRPGDYVELDLSDGYDRKIRMARLDWRPVWIDFYMSSSPEINSMATPHSVVVTYGMMRFIKSDDELAVVLGHEVAHILLKHHRKMAGVNLLSNILNSILGAKLDSEIPGLGSAVVSAGISAVESGYSRELEMQADYWGLYFAYRAGYDIDVGKDIWERFAIEVPESMIRDFWRTHPTSVERRVYISKIVEQLKAGKFPSLYGDSED